MDSPGSSPSPFHWSGVSINVEGLVKTTLARGCGARSSAGCAGVLGRSAPYLESDSPGKENGTAGRASCASGSKVRGWLDGRGNLRTGWGCLLLSPPAGPLAVGESPCGGHGGPANAGSHPQTPPPGPDRRHLRRRDLPGPRCAAALLRAAWGARCRGSSLRPLVGMRSNSDESSCSSMKSVT